MANIRTFIAIELNPLVDVLTRIQEGLRNGPGGRAGRWVGPEGIHLTLKFLGDVPEEKLPDIFAAMDRACQGYSSLSVRLAACGCFPNPRSPRVVWVGAEEETGQLQALQQALEAELGKLGFEREQRPFRPHLTLARIQQRATREEAALLGAATLSCAIPGEARMTAHEIYAIKSELKPTGAVYTPLHTTRLAT